MKKKGCTSYTIHIEPEEEELLERWARRPYRNARERDVKHDKRLFLFHLLTEAIQAHREFEERHRDVFGFQASYKLEVMESDNPDPLKPKGVPGYRLERLEAMWQIERLLEQAAQMEVES